MGHPRVFGRSVGTTGVVVPTSDILHHDCHAFVLVDVYEFFDVVGEDILVEFLGVELAVVGEEGGAGLLKSASGLEG